MLTKPNPPSAMNSEPVEKTASSEATKINALFTNALAARQPLQLGVQFAPSLQPLTKT